MDTLVLQGSAGLQNVTGLRVGPRTPRSRRAKDLHGREIEREREREREAEKQRSRESGKQREREAERKQGTCACISCAHPCRLAHTLTQRRTVELRLKALSGSFREHPVSLNNDIDCIRSTGALSSSNTIVPCISNPGLVLAQQLQRQCGACQLLATSAQKV